MGGLKVNKLELSALVVSRVSRDQMVTSLSLALVSRLLHTVKQ
jgi:hypothetical protein